jgi:hypothetical protein
MHANRNCNYSLTNYLLDKISPYIDTDSVQIKTESTDWEGKKYQSDWVTIMEEPHISFEVFGEKDEIIVFFFTAHEHFDNYNTPTDDESENDEGDDTGNTDYIESAASFLINLLTLPIRCRKKYDRKSQTDERYYFVHPKEEELIYDGFLEGIIPNPFGRKTKETITWRFNKETGRFDMVN